MKHKKQVKNGFTLIELLVVITIIGVLTALFITNMVGVRERSKDARSKSNLNQLKTALRLFYNDNQNYPATGSIDEPVPGAIFSGAGDVVYMQEVPVFDSYEQTSNGDGFLVSVEMENEGDPEICESWTRCGVVGSCVQGEESAYYICAN